MKMGGALYLRTSLFAAWFGQQGCWPVQVFSKEGLYPKAGGRRSFMKAQPWFILGVSLLGLIGSSGFPAATSAHLVNYTRLGFRSLVPPGTKMRIGITLHPYYSYVANIVGDRAEVIPLFPNKFDPHHYREQPGDMDRVIAMDLIVLNAVGHDNFAIDLIQSDPLKDVPIYVIPANNNVPLNPGTASGLTDKNVNPHTFLSITAALRQLTNIFDALRGLDPANAAAYRQNARQYALKLRRLKAEAMQRIADIPALELRCAAANDAYNYLLQEFGLTPQLILETEHGQPVTAKQVRAFIDALNEQHIQALFLDQHLAAKDVRHIREATEVRVYTLSHITDGAYTPERYEQTMRANVEAITQAILDAWQAKHQR